ncbi:conserved hypothetical protein [Vibrio nigripulchritudo MADA3029]|uniref:DUF3293 domain-containing protein n=1 Tax=Vibrio nigripulchritudo TaxID=28173 RepID=UPI00021C10A1|nr:DUF3293 domain-containing protein [Vibrio nigripulchritudo]EGU61881.1 hypothetical protein VINI7043_28705 [Vibrio nigripulchritudo ATCC 27043]CCN45409.1 conserved hypothetical protein [Vibrio nigripulchritudo MADA3020]CCN53708.1 conserved hypothetical protein [Vibrio nigripulchritudo MADA3021]CCN58596.1 conserved hypothetical protein [Vibrio nigripulchritudo MADA3029]CCN80500.1 conserved hypothetical protein [Vibrio nigripulchritudo BLFn1]
MQIDSSLIQAYLATYFYTDKPIAFHRFCVITACNPRSKKVSDFDNNLRNKQLEADLAEHVHQPVLAGDETKQWCEESYIVEISLQKAIKLAKRYEQNAIYYIEDGELFLVFVSGEQMSAGTFSEKVRFVR